LWDLAEREIMTAIARNLFPLQAARFSPTGRHVAATCTDSDEGVFVWGRVNPAMFQQKPYKLRFPGERCCGAAWAPDGASLVATFDSGRMAWWELGSETRPITRTSHRGAGGPVAYSPDGRLLLTAGKDGLIDMWDNSTHSRVTTFNWQI